MRAAFIPKSNHETNRRDFCRYRETSQEHVVYTHSETHLRRDISVTHLDETADVGCEHGPA